MSCVMEIVTSVYVRFLRLGMKDTVGLLCFPQVTQLGKTNRASRQTVWPSDGEVHVSGKDGHLPTALCVSHPQQLSQAALKFLSQDPA